MTSLLALPWQEAFSRHVCGDWLKPLVQAAPSTNAHRIDASAASCHRNSAGFPVFRPGYSEV